MYEVVEERFDLFLPLGVFEGWHVVRPTHRCRNQRAPMADLERLGDGIGPEKRNRDEPFSLLANPQVQGLDDRESVRSGGASASVSTINQESSDS